MAASGNHNGDLAGSTASGLVGNPGQELGPTAGERVVRLDAERIVEHHRQQRQLRGREAHQLGDRAREQAVADDGADVRHRARQAVEVALLAAERQRAVAGSLLGERCQGSEAIGERFAIGTTARLVANQGTERLLGLVDDGELAAQQTVRLQQRLDESRDGGVARWRWRCLAGRRRQDGREEGAQVVRGSFGRRGRWWLQGARP